MPVLPPHAALVYANHAQFGPGGTYDHARHVESRMLVWCKAGRGHVVINGQKRPLEAGDFCFLPWGHSIVYQPSSRDPFWLGGTHIIPNHSPRHPIVMQVAHSRQDPLADCPWRRDAPLPWLPSGRVLEGSFKSCPALGHLAEYGVEVFRRGPLHPGPARTLGRALLAEVLAVARHPVTAPSSLPPDLQRIMGYIQEHLTGGLSLGEMIEFSELSGSTLARLFARHLGTTPARWVQTQRMERASGLLRTSRLNVAQIAQAVGLADPAHFCRLFKQHSGLTPLHYRKQSGML